MIRHIVLFRFRSDAPDEQVRAAGNAILGMRGRIPAARSVSWGPNLAPSAGEWPWVLTVECESMEGVAEYIAHPVHRETVDRYITPIRDGRIAVDVEVAG